MDKKTVIMNCVYNMTHGFFLGLPSLVVRRAYLGFFCKRFGKDVYIPKGLDVRWPVKVSIGNHVVINRHCVIDGRGGLEICDNVDIAQDVFIWTEDHDTSHPQHLSRTAPVKICDHVWLASRATILPGVTIGRGGVVACGAIVKHDVPEKAIVGGVLAKVIGQRDNLLDYTLHYRPKFYEYR